MKMVTSEILHSAPTDPKMELKESDMKSTLHMQHIGSRVPHFHSLCSMISLFVQNIALPLTPMLKFHSATIVFKTWPIVKDSNSLYSW